VPLTIAFYSFDDPTYACARLRVLEPVRTLGDAVRLLPGVASQGAGHHVRTDILAQADLVIIQRYFPSPGTVPALAAIFDAGKPVVYDTDDDWSAVPPHHPFHPRMAAVLPHIEETARRAALVTVSTPVLAEVYRMVNARVQVVPNLLPDALWKQAKPPTRPVTAVLLAATSSHQPDLAPLETALTELARKMAGKVRFVFYGCPPAGDSFPGATILPFAPDYAAYAARLPRLGCTIGLAPLADTPFNRAKSPVKWMEYAVAGATGIFADLPPYRDVVTPGETGLLAGSDPKAWVEALSHLIGDAALRRRLATQAMAAVAEKHLLSKGAGQYYQAWSQAVAGDRP
jgi:hypothetical protein